MNSRAARDRGIGVRNTSPMNDEPRYTITAIDRETGESVTTPITAPGIEEAMIANEGLPNPDDVIDDDDGDGD
jgi:hypothetical protein